MGCVSAKPESNPAVSVNVAPKPRQLAPTAAVSVQQINPSDSPTANKQLTPQAHIKTSANEIHVNPNAPRTALVTGASSGMQSCHQLLHVQHIMLLYPLRHTLTPSYSICDHVRRYRSGHRTAAAQGGLSCGRQLALAGATDQGLQQRSD